MNGEKNILGCIADDFTGASDAASFLQKAGLEVVLFNGIPAEDTDIAGFDAAVVALKTRTMAVNEAVKESVEAVKWLEKKGATHFYCKYCSTFDSTEEGNIGPIADAVMEYLGVKYTLLCPSLPVNGRVVKNGLLYVDGVLLSESPMKNHPLTPMKESSISKLMEAQSKYKAYPIKAADMEANSVKEEEHYYLIPDYKNDNDARNIVAFYGDLKLLTGGSGLLTYWAAHLFHKKRDNYKNKGVILAGSCSKATLEQIKVYIEAGNPSFKILPEKLMKESGLKQQAIDFINANQNEVVLVYSSDKAENVKEIQKLGKAEVAERIEQTLSEIAFEMVQKGYTSIIVAGGETSGAVTQKLGFSSFRICESVAPGIPVMVPIENNRIRLVLKSGNFGQPDFFKKAIEKIKK